MIGKIIGGIVGAFAAGPFGFVAGVATGHVIDSQIGGKSKSGTSSSKPFDTSNRLFIEFACQGAAKLAKAKGFVAQSDINELEKIFKQLNFDSEMRRRAIDYFRTAKNDSYEIEDIARTFMKHFPQRQARHAFFSILLRVAFSDGKLCASEAVSLRNVARILHLDPSVIDDAENGGSRARSSAGNNARTASGGRGASHLAEQYAILGLSPSASADEVKKAYRAKCKELHPDILRSKGIGDHAMKVIEEELRRINDAYEQIEKSFGKRF